jgi:predicted metal-dependent enzyme (double-stranded beta helix superfamily)
MNTWVEKNEFVEQVEILVQQLMVKGPHGQDPRFLLKEISSRPVVTTPEVGTRTRQVMFQNDQFEFVLMTWGAGSSSPIHGHGGSQCYMYVLSGELIETRYRPYNSMPVHEAKLTNGSVTHIHDEASFHKLSSVTGAVSLHLYSHPLHSMQVFDETQNEWFDKVAAEIT